QKAEKARDRLKKMEKTDKAGEKKLVQELAKLAKGLNEFRNDQKELTEKLEKLPKKKLAEFNTEDAQKLKEIMGAEQKWAKWTKGSIDELTKMAAGFVDDFGLRDDANRVYEEIEKVENKS